MSYVAIPYLLADGTVASSAKMNANFTAVTEALRSGIYDLNVSTLQGSFASFSSLYVNSFSAGQINPLPENDYIAFSGLNFGQSTLDYYSTGSFTAQVYGFASTYDVSITYQRVGNTVSLKIPSSLHESNANALYIKTVPASLCAASDTGMVPLYLCNAGAGFMSLGYLASNGYLWGTAGAYFSVVSFSSSGVKGFLANEITYRIG